MTISYRTRFGGVACAAAGCAALLGLAGCSGGGSPSPGGQHTAAPTPSTTTPAASTSSAASPGPAPTGTGRSAASGGDGSGGNGAHGVATCTTSQLRVATGQRNGAMGATQVQLVFTNRGGRTCVEAGYPGVSFVTGDQGDQVGSPARRQGGGYSSVTLRPGGTAHATFRYPQVGNLPSGSCKPTTVRGLRVYPPDQKAAVYVPLAVRACTARGVGVGEITAMRTGTGTVR
ncbi:hypothetical protein Athai_45410 [Actinocatenispora thailandica]|uniref:DUF4232 domain-containing protein n=1 Tax=Actinocatenispora thailandica TaxID=227318 RepID=A0A7R7HYE2_9ACTN|nr:DUF4232 domain-containing protein [Actinocatenispora thailandica]BCJ37038.1 hypothetical protein Athai_45410 [Actinocatenispora thailandica]